MSRGTRGRDSGHRFRDPTPHPLTAARTPGARESMLCASWAGMLRPTLVGLRWCVGMYAVRGADGRSQCAAVRWRIGGALQEPRATGMANAPIPSTEEQRRSTNDGLASYLAGGVWQCWAGAG